MARPSIGDRDHISPTIRSAIDEQITGLTNEMQRWKQIANDRLYMLEAYRSMLGPKGLSVAAMWEAKGVTRVHFDLGPDGLKLSGEDRAQLYLDLETVKRMQKIEAEGAVITEVVSASIHNPSPVQKEGRTEPFPVPGASVPGEGFPRPERAGNGGKGPSA